MSIVRVGPSFGPTARLAGVPRNRANVLDVPLASPANLIIGAENAVRATWTDTASPIASADPSTRSNRSRSERASSTVSRASIVDMRRSCSSGRVSERRSLDLPAELAQRVEDADEDDDEGGEPDRAEHCGEQDGEFACGHGRAHVWPCSSRRSIDRSSVC